MRRVFYAGVALTTTAGIAEALARLAVAMSALGETDMITIPIVTEPTGKTATVQLLVGPGIPLLSMPLDHEEPEPDFSTDVTLLQMHRFYPYAQPDDGGGTFDGGEPDLWDPDLHG
ncbi:hypothetical protein [Microbacterium imperiale]|uniref:Uncharacterized protein n=1 Tax=Microbacterium imperiale TaxID=33884 RepID=A0A9W6HH62_9MICO|nr:hypothetical protein [Microbacterium imperiale]BFE39396.1 hypothetical protein GCM10017544_03520 [Microbacterium imperiale]GLJ79737.1 hypothetical protein GCM10017586_14190 [Microbacterium imperiale]